MENLNSPYAPIVVFVYDRYTHLQKCIEHLQKNPLASKSSLYIVSDAAKDNSVLEKVRQIREYTYNIKGFNSVTLIARSTNVGSFENVVQAYAELFKKHDRIIALEDDVLVSTQFLEYVNKGLDYFENDPKCFAVCGYFYPIKTEESNSFIKLPSIFNAWGYGIWRDKWQKKQFKFSVLKDYFKDKSARKYFLSEAIVVDNVIGDFYKLGKIPMDALIAYQMFLKKEFSVFPSKTLTINIGFDNTGENCTEDIRFASQKFSIVTGFDFGDSTHFSELVQKELEFFFSSFARIKPDHRGRIKAKSKDILGRFRFLKFKLINTHK